MDHQWGVLSLPFVFSTPGIQVNALSFIFFSLTSVLLKPPASEVLTMPSGEVLLSSVLRSCLSSSLSQDTTVLFGEGAPAPASSKLLTALSPWIGRLLQESGPDSCLLLPFLTSQEFSSYLASSLQLAFGDKGAWKEVQGVHSVLAGAPSPAPEREPPSTATSLAPSPAPEQSIVQLKIEPEEDVLENINFVNEDVDKEEVNSKESVRDISGHVPGLLLDPVLVVFGTCPETVRQLSGNLKNS